MEGCAPVPNLKSLGHEAEMSTQPKLPPVISGGKSVLERRAELDLPESWKLSGFCVDLLIT